MGELWRLDKASFLESLVSAVLLDGAEATCRDVDDYGFLEFRNINALFLEIWIATNSWRRVELGSTSTVGVSSSNH